MIIVERASEDDHPDVIAMDHIAQVNTERAQYLTRAILDRQMIVARQGATRVGYAIVNRGFFEQIFLALLYAHADYRRQGVATALVDYAIKTCPEPKLFTSTNESNIPAQALYEKYGFIRSGYIENLDEGDPELIYVKFLD